MTWPACGRTACTSGFPGMLEFKFDDPERGPLVAFLCPFCITEAPALLKEISAVRQEQEQELLSGPRPDEHGTKAQA